MARRAPYWSCRKCGYRNLREHRKCRGCDKAKPKRKVPVHAVALRDVSYEDWAAISVEIHGGELHTCGVCGRLPSKVRHNDRDHDHDNGRIRGLACPGRYGCNMFMPKGLTAARAQQIADYLKRVERYYQTEEELNAAS